MTQEPCARYRAVVLDLDDTVFDHSGSAAAGFRGWFAELGLPAPEIDSHLERWRALEAVAFEEYRAGRCTFQDQRRVRVRAFVPGAAGWDDARADAAFEGYLARYREAWSAFDDAVPALVALRAAGLRVAVLTNGDHAQQADKLARIGIEHLLDTLFASSELPAAKPDPACFDSVAGALGLAPGECLMVGDDIAKDIDGALAAGWGAIWLDRSATPGGGRHASISSLAELLPLVLRPHS